MIKPSKDKKQEMMLAHFKNVFWNKWTRHVKNNKIQFAKEEEEDDLQQVFFPCIIVNCKFDKDKQNGRSRGGFAVPLRSFDKLDECHPLIANKIKYIQYMCKEMNIKSRNEEKVFFGSCAEDDAANKILTNLGQKPLPQLSQLKFTTAKRTRTGEEEPYCFTCEKVFG